MCLRACACVRVCVYVYVYVFTNAQMHKCIDESDQDLASCTRNTF